MPVGIADAYAEDLIKVGTVDRTQRVSIRGDFRFAVQLLVAVTAEAAAVSASFGSMDFHLYDSVDRSHWSRVPPVDRDPGRVTNFDRGDMGAIARYGVIFGPFLALELYPEEQSRWDGVAIRVVSKGGMWGYREENIA